MEERTPQIAAKVAKPLLLGAILAILPACQSAPVKSGVGSQAPAPEAVPAKPIAATPVTPKSVAKALRPGDCEKRPEGVSASFVLRGSALVMTGEIDSKTPEILTRALRAHPTVRLLMLECVPGSSDDDANLKAARMVRAAKLNTHVVDGGMIASGGTDFFLAGVERSIGRDVYVGVHSWSGDDVPSPRKLPRSHPEHKKYLEYYAAMKIPAAFYWFTLRAAPSSGMHNMTDAELVRYRVTTR